jgi:TLC domain
MTFLNTLLTYFIGNDVGNDEYNRIETLHRLPIYVYIAHPDFGFQQMLQSLFYSTIYIWIIFVISTLLGTHVFYRNVPRTENLQGAHKVTHFIGNVSITFLGYYFYWRLPKDATMEEKMVGFTDVYPLLCLQISKQLWALLIGVLLERKERRINYLHHSGVAFVSFSLMSFTIGLRYFLPFMFGIMETSSLVLAGIEAMREYPEQGSLRYPKLYTALQLAFAILFLYIRCYLFLPQAYTFLRWSYWALLSIPPGNVSFIMKGIAWAVWSAGSFLILLQAFWGVLIVKKLIRDVFFRKSKVALKKRI